MRNAKLEIGKTYKNRNGSDYICLSSSIYGATLQEVKTGWTFYAYIITKYEDNTIEWDYSLHGRFEE